MKTFSILLKSNNRIDVNASNIRSAYKKLCDIGAFKYEVTNMFLRYNKEGFCYDGFIITDESIKAVNCFGITKNNNIKSSINNLFGCEVD